MFYEDDEEKRNYKNRSYSEEIDQEGEEIDEEDSDEENEDKSDDEYFNEIMMLDDLDED